MNRHLLLLCLCGLLVFPVFADDGSADNAGTLDRIIREIEREGEMETDLLWLSKDAAVSEKGEVLETRMFANYDPAELTTRLTRDASDCEMQLFLEPMGTDKTASEMVRDAGWVFVGEVAEIQAGFVWGSIPGMLIRLEPSEFLVGSRLDAPVHVLFKAADFEVAGKRICQAYARYADAPKVGERMVVISEPGEEAFLSDSRLMLNYDPDGLITVHEDDRINLPRRLRRDRSLPAALRVPSAELTSLTTWIGETAKEKE
ncbi:MAG: hypothetical protein AAGD38_17075 [Acidobacteriota bacterium]